MHIADVSVVSLLQSPHLLIAQ